MATHWDGSLQLAERGATRAIRRLAGPVGAR